MKSIFLAATSGLLAFVGIAAASAADLTPEPAPAVEAPALTFSWTGFYIGVHGGIGGGPVKDTIDGYTFDGDELIDSLGTLATLDTNSFGGIIGAQIGYNYEFDNKVVLGAVADFNGTNIKSKIDVGIPPLAVNADLHTQLDWYGTIRAKLGYAFDNFLIYGTGGAAYGKVKTSLGASYEGDSVFDYSASDTKWGWTAGAGVEYAITKNVTISTEYLYVDLGKANILDPTPIFDGFGASANAKTAFHTLTLGVNYKF